MEIITVTKKNLEAEHICCAISNNNDCQVASKKSWLSKRFDDGLVFKKGNVRGKCFIEYIPAEKAWAPIDAPEYMYIDCLWVSGQFKGQGNSTLLLNSCIEDSKQQGKKGLVILSAKKKMPFLSDPKFLKYKGFTLCDSAEPFYDLYCLKFDEKAVNPTFKPQVKKPRTANDDGYVLYYTNQCPYTAKYVPVAEEIAIKLGARLKTVHIETAEQAQRAPAPLTAYTVFYNGEFITNEILSEKKLEAMFSEKK